MANWRPDKNDGEWVIGLYIFLQVSFLCAKLAGLVRVSWWFVFSPALGFCIGLIVGLIFFEIRGFRQQRKECKDSVKNNDRPMMISNTTDDSLMRRLRNERQVFPARLFCNSWKKGTPTDDGYYLIAFRCPVTYEKIAFAVIGFDSGVWRTVIPDIDILGWQEIEPYVEIVEEDEKVCLDEDQS